MRIEFDQTEEDLVAGTAAQFRYDPYLRGNYFGQRTAAIVTLVLGAVLLGCGLWNLSGRDPGPAGPVAAAVGISALIVGVNVWPTHARAAAQAKVLVTNALKHPTGRMLLGTRALELAADGFRVSTAFSEAFVRWSAVLFLRTDDDHLYLGLPGPSMYVVPRQAFETDSKFEAFAAHAEALWRANTAAE